MSAIVFNQLFGPPALKYALRAARENGQQSDENHYFSCWMAVELALDASADVKRL